LNFWLRGLLARVAVSVLLVPAEDIGERIDFLRECVHFVGDALCCGTCASAGSTGV
jgi:hypothetical protein